MTHGRNLLKKGFIEKRKGFIKREKGFDTDKIIKLEKSAHFLAIRVGRNSDCPIAIRLAEDAYYRGATHNGDNLKGCITVESGLIACKLKLEGFVYES